MSLSPRPEHAGAARVPPSPAEPPPRPQSAAACRPSSSPVRSVRPSSAGTARPAWMPQPVRPHPSHQWPAKTSGGGPGPGRYNPGEHSGWKRALDVPIGRAERFTAALFAGVGEQVPEDTPGPAAYVASDEFRDKKLGHRFRQKVSKAREPLVTPGPGGYDVRSPDASSHPQSFGAEGRDAARRRNGEAVVDGCPGPGTYNVQSGKRGPAWRMGRSKRKLFSGAQSTAADNWRTQFYRAEAGGSGVPLRAPQHPGKPSTPSAVFPRAARGSRQGIAQPGPGPGSYNALAASEHTRRDPTRVGFAGSGSRAPYGAAASTKGNEEGKGASEPASRKKVFSTRGGTIAKAARRFAGDDMVAAASEVPGPDAYEPLAAEAKLRRRVMAHGFASGARVRADPSTIGPGPGGYEAAAAEEKLVFGGAAQGPSFTRASRSEAAAVAQRAREVPGPGAYAVDGRPRPKARGTKGKAVQRDPFGTAGLLSRDTPGPQYDLGNSRAGAPAVAFARQHRAGRRTADAAGPGPADYAPTYAQLRPDRKGALLYLTG